VGYTEFTQGFIKFKQNRTGGEETELWRNLEQNEGKQGLGNMSKRKEEGRVMV